MGPTDDDRATAAEAALPGFADLPGWAEALDDDDLVGGLVRDMVLVGMTKRRGARLAGASSKQEVLARLHELLHGEP